MRLASKFNPGEDRETLKRWQSDPDKQDKWVVFDGIGVLLVDTLEGCEHRSICKVSELGCLLGEDAHLTLDQFLYQDY